MQNYAERARVLYEFYLAVNHYRFSGDIELGIHMDTDTLPVDSPDAYAPDGPYGDIDATRFIIVFPNGDTVWETIADESMHYVNGWRLAAGLVEGFDDATAVPHDAYGNPWDDPGEASEAACAEPTVDDLLETVLRALLDKLESH